MPPRVKICGLKRPEDALTAAKAGADYLGFVFFERSPRHLTMVDAVRLRDRLPHGPERVGVFVDPDFALLSAAVDALDLDWIQLHGDETPKFASLVRARFGLNVIKAVPVATAEDVAEARRWYGHADALLFDAKPPATADALPGGNAVRFPWGLMQGQDIALPWFLAGGLTAENVAEAISLSGAPALDVSSGVESAPGEKSAEKIEAFLKAAKSPI